ncbi:acetamidase/formamidase family protein [Paenibacillus sp.]|jgi:acetamidase/formamidase|uniref:acetamidase/formamidase family protein n=1 Tax=Paenibacillus sp. TaxID=58172 RepID=UPI002816DFC1|nr:acetamidase/formamidase family protein [Paenibacillus sp.]MDR0271537.1 acetamidase/formamidase family protein [Paenibacillus sp.]
MAVHEIQLGREALIGSITKDTEPLITISSGDSIRFQTPDAAWGVGPSYTEREKPFVRRVNLDGGHALIGPICIENAKRGMVLAIQFNRIVPGKYGFTCAGHYPNWQNQKLHLTEYKEITLDWTLDKENMEGSCRMNDMTYSVPLNPFMGVIGMPPEEEGIHSTWPPRFCGGNMDCRELVTGSTIYLPVPVDGGYLVIGDGHAAQGDGEVSCQAIECPMDEVEVTIQLLEDLHLANPRANTPAGWLTFGFHEDLNEATVQALDGMLDLMGELYGLDRVQAIALGSAVIDLRITQIVNGVKGVHACLPHGAMKRDQG